MYLATISFGPKGNLPKSKLISLAKGYLEALTSIGQILDPPILAWIGGVLVAYVIISRRDSMAKKYHLEWGLRKLEDCQRQTGRDPVWTIIDDDMPKHFPSWKKSPFLVLHASYYYINHPILRGTDGADFPAYLFPIGALEKRWLYSWMRSYVNHMGAWFYSDKLEIPAYKELADPFSDLANQGRGYCSRIEEATGIPTYYFLFRNWGRGNHEKKRVCPSCGKRWLLQRPYEWKERRIILQFLCQKCRLVSNLTYSDEDEGLASIGEYDAQRTLAQSD